MNGNGLALLLAPSIRTSVGALLLGAGPLLPLRTAYACTICHDEVSVQLRAALLGADGLASLAALAAPVPLLIASVIAVRWLAPWLCGRGANG